MFRDDNELEGILSFAQTARAILSTVALTSASALFVVPVAAQASVCAETDRWFECSTKVKAAINATTDAKAALEAAGEWAELYDTLYKAHARDTWTWTDQRLLEEAISRLYDEGLGKYLDPAGLAFGLALAKYLPRLAAALEFAGGAYATAFMGLLAPSPIANDFTAASVDNKAIQGMVASRLPPEDLAVVRQRYPDVFNKAFVEAQAKKNDKP